ncbi:hypothetical protein H0H92_015226 [Tricholoma furcatifolium]|nr:hypothetical protein H0H92_015226 [Tricholoma furcatifolium]
MYIYRGKISWSVKFRDEVVTVVFPSIRADGAQVYLFSQWSTIPAGFESKAFSALGVVKPSYNESETAIILSFSHPSGVIDLFATRSDNLLLLRTSDSVFAEDLATLSLVYHSHAHPRIYTGKLNFHASLDGKKRTAADESLLAITCTDSDVDETNPERLLCVFTQWSETDATPRVNADFISSSESDFKGITSHRSLADGGFTFSLRQGNDRSQVLLIEVDSNAALKSEVPLTSFSTLVEVKNKTTGFISCEVTTATPGTDELFVYSGHALGVIGILFAVASSVAIASNFAGFAFAVGCYLVSNLQPIANTRIVTASYRGMAPDDSFKIDVSDVMHLLVTRIRQEGRNLIIEYAQQKYSTATPKVEIDAKFGPWKALWTIDQAVPEGRKMVTRGLLELPNVRASMVGVEVGDHNNYMNMGIYSTSRDDDTKPLYHGVFTDKWSLPLLEYLEEYNASIAFSSLSSDDCQILRLSNSPYKPYLVLMLRYVRLDGADAESTSVTGAIPVVGYTPNPKTQPPQTRANLEANLQHAISLDENIRYSIYYYTPSGNYGKLMGVKSTAKKWSIARLKKDHDPSTYTLLRIERPVVVNPVYTLSSK